MSVAEAEDPILFTDIPGEHVDLVEPHVRPLFESETRYRRRDWSGYVDAIRAGHIRLWVAGRRKQLVMACLTEIQNRESGKVAVIMYVVGKQHPDWIGHIRNIEQWARENGCVSIECWARPGWSNLLQGYRKSAVLLEKDLSDGPG